MENKEIVPSGQQATEQKFDSAIVQQRAEMAAIQVAKEAEAQVNARFIMAIKNPRNEDNASVKIVNTCKNPLFAEKAVYKKPVGGKNMEGLSIRFAEEMARNWKNLYVNTSIVFEDEEKRIVRVMVLDLESNLNYDKTILIEKTVERKFSGGREILAERLNTKNERVFIVKATEDELMVKESALASKAMRNGILRCIPSHILDLAMKTAKESIRTGINKDPAAAKHSTINNFGKLNILPKEIEKYLGHSLDQIAEHEIEDLKMVYSGISSGSTTWKEIVDNKIIDVEVTNKEEGTVDNSEAKTWDELEKINASNEKGTDVKDSIKK